MMDMTSTPAPAAIIKRDRLLVLSGIAGIAALAWLDLFPLTRGMNEMSMDATTTIPGRQVWSGADAMVVFAMWVVMMVAMMTPSVSPTLLLFTSILRGRALQPFARVGLFLMGYLLVWSGFSAAAALAQLALHEAVSTGALIGGAVLAGAGIFQFTSLKHACLARCRSPQGFFMTEWREGARGALVMGLRHGVSCLGCCWLLMSLLFVAGVMNLVWMAAIAIFVLVEKVAPFGEWVSRVAGVLLISAGVWMALNAIA